jgi:HEAT repeat protein
MRLPRVQFTVRKLMAAVAICAMFLGIAPIFIRFCYDHLWSWTVLRDVNRGQSMRYSAEGLSSVGPPVVQALREALRSSPKKTRLDAIQSLGVMGFAPQAGVRDLAKPAVPDLIDALQDKDEEVRIWAACALGEFGPNAVSAVEPLIESVRDEAHPVVIPSAIQALGRMGPVASQAVPVLAPMVMDPKHRNHLMAVHAFWRIGPKGRAEASLVVPKLIDGLSGSRSPRERAWVAAILSEMGPAAREAIPALSMAAGDPAQEVGSAANNALRALTATDANSDSGVPTETRIP